MSNLIVRLDAKDLERIVTSVTSEILGGLGPLRSLLDSSASGEGIQVVSARSLARKLGKTARHLYRLESEGKMPQRRRISRARTGYLSHELEGTKATDAVVIERRTMNREQVAKKLDVTVRTVERLLDDLSMSFPRAIDGLWLVRELDQWLIERPKVQPARRS